jgi:hypothetical protein
MELKLTAWDGKQSPWRGSSCSRTVARCQLWCSSSTKGKADGALCGRTFVSMPEEAMLGGALEARASPQLRGTDWWDVAIEIRAKWPCSGLLVLLEPVWPDEIQQYLVWSKVKERVWTTWHLSSGVHGVLELVLLAGRGIRGRESGIVAICKVGTRPGSASSPASPVQPAAACSSQAWTVHPSSRLN